MVRGVFDLLRTGRLLIGRRPVLPVSVGDARPGPETEGEVGQLYLVPGRKPALYICVEDGPDGRRWAGVRLETEKRGTGDRRPSGTPAPTGDGRGDPAPTGETDPSTALCSAQDDRTEEVRDEGK